MVEHGTAVTRKDVMETEGMQVILGLRLRQPDVRKKNMFLTVSSVRKTSQTVPIVSRVTIEVRTPFT
jgi:hypothetical protein